ncbi:hypothetical protein Q5424_14090 [Conexibacter sp. JD483]|uniref:hypothetical protein n=1 Tax=unclassified Conexibacter TaxID=2627773 RepID=UPI002725DBB9|nr:MULTISPECIES: hypothetical protein [unclassified Conexibacter]MDO8187666.1 hypothetical protein [Conexibacter sp. CPCC 205706]MDO8199851.1 hypothetical protein [Conexibacter sp. CPCC 205762]MDR9370228.1 hypothetical protein [Conexibacter sp. JD483]
MRTRRPTRAVATTRVVCAGDAETGRAIAASAARHPGLEMVAAVSAQDASTVAAAVAEAQADVALLAPASPEVASALVEAVVATGASAVVLLPSPGWGETELARHRAAAVAAGSALLLIEGEDALVRDVLPAVLALACVSVDRVDVHVPASSGSLDDGPGPLLSSLLRGDTAGVRFLPSEGETPCARISIVGDGNIEFVMEGEAIRDGGRAGLVINAIPALLEARPGLHRLVELPLPHAWAIHAGGAE